MEKGIAMGKVCTVLKMWFCALLFTLLGASASAQLQGDTFASAKQKGSAKVVYTYIQTEGFVTKDAAGQMKGLSVDLMHAFGLWLKKYEGITLQPTYHDKDTRDFKNFLEHVRTGRGGVFGIGNITITEARRKVFAFSPPFITNVAILVTHQDVPTLGSTQKIATAFAGMQGVVVKATTVESRLNKLKSDFYPTLPLQTAFSSPEAIKMVAGNSRLFTQVDFSYYLNALEAGMPLKRHPVADDASERFGIIMPKDSDWSPVLERFIKAFVNSHEYRKIIGRNLGPDALKLLDSVNAPAQ